MGKLKTPEQKEKERNARLLRTYGITSEDYDFMLKEQGHVCKICKSDGGERSLHVDHDHKYKYLKITAQKGIIPRTKWYASCLYRGIMFDSVADKKNIAIHNVRLKLKTASVRGLLCNWCNRGLQFYKDNPELLGNACQYLSDHNSYLKDFWNAGKK